MGPVCLSKDDFIKTSPQRNYNLWRRSDAGELTGKGNINVGTAEQKSKGHPFCGRLSISGGILL